MTLSAMSRPLFYRHMTVDRALLYRHPTVICLISCQFLKRESLWWPGMVCRKSWNFAVVGVHRLTNDWVAKVDAAILWGELTRLEMEWNVSSRQFSIYMVNKVGLIF